MGSKDNEIALAPHRSARDKLISKLETTNLSLFLYYRSALHHFENSSVFIRFSGRMPLTGGGEINSYSIFSELMKNLINSLGRVGIIIPTGIATDATTANFFSYLINNKILISLYDFENKSIFEAVHASFKFCLLTISGLNIPEEHSDMSFFLHSVNEIKDDNRHFHINSEDIWIINPNTGNCPIFRNKKDAIITKKIYANVPILIKESENNPSISLKQGLFHMSWDSSIFRTYEQLFNEGGVLKGNVFHIGANQWFPLYEAKMFHQYDHRYGTFKNVNERGNTSLSKTSYEEYLDKDYLIRPWYWVPEKEVLERINDNRKFLFAYRKISNATNERCGIFSILPLVGLSDSGTIINHNFDKLVSLAFFGSLNSISFDYILRLKTGGMNLSNFIVKQVAVLPQSMYSISNIQFTAVRVIELSYTAWDLEPFAQDILSEIGTETWGHYFPDNPLEEGRPHPFRWDEARRAVLRAELDALYAKLYGLTKSEFEYILTTFPVLERNEIREFGEYRTRRLVLEAWERMES